MNESSSRPRRSPSVVLLDAMLGMAAAVQSGNLPGVRTGTTKRRRPGIVWLIMGVLVAGAGTALLVSAILRGPGGLAALPPAGVAAPAPIVSSPVPGSTQPAPSTPAPTTTAVATPRPSRSTSTVAPSLQPTTPGGARLTADYVAANGSGLLGYRATVTLTSHGPDPAADWQLTVTLPRSTLRVAAVTGATVEQAGAVWTFTPDDSTRELRPGATAEIAFDVRGATLVDAQPTDCRIDDDPCGGLTS
ncbi:cellulose binding domain-containing protein [Paractinoplanes rishiriensis]|uniref:CBM2 domain-containing protein n=1 Tax=Paractinoplanes rishiriensis TaxID=1050105 RepID=A0A919JVE5_9ACTN|nr:cellulose binding domain-containing protein [Actinoplanes rishiriensis]GIE95550.1 hypothetical protein Ari01nite_30150 [Actinoplanes rishiriensis]